MAFFSRAYPRCIQYNIPLPEGQGTRVTMRFEYEMPGGGVGKLFDRLVVERMNAQNLERSLENLKRLLES